MAGLCTWATVHWIQFGESRTAEMLDLGGRPEGCASWKIGPDGKAASDGSRMPSDIWCAIGMYRSRADAEAAFDEPSPFLPFLGEVTQYWQALLQPVSHKGESNLLDRSSPGAMFVPSADNPAGPMLVMTTAGFDLGPGFDVRRVVDFRRNVDAMREIVSASEGSIAHQVFAPHVRGDDGVTLSVWRDRDPMAAFAYRGGPHRDRIDQHKAQSVMDRSSFTRFRAVRSAGSWNGSDPMAAA